MRLVEKINQRLGDHRTHPLDRRQFGFAAFRQRGAAKLLDRAKAFEQVAALGTRYGITRFMDWVPELTTTYQLKLLGQ